MMEPLLVSKSLPPYRKCFSLLTVAPRKIVKNTAQIVMGVLFVLLLYVFSYPVSYSYLNAVAQPNVISTEWQLADRMYAPVKWLRFKAAWTPDFLDIAFYHIADVVYPLFDGGGILGKNRGILSEQEAFTREPLLWERITGLRPLPMPPPEIPQIPGLDPVPEREVPLGL